MFYQNFIKFVIQKNKNNILDLKKRYKLVVECSKKKMEKRYF